MTRHSRRSRCAACQGRDEVEARLRAEADSWRASCAQLSGALEAKRLECQGLSETVRAPGLDAQRPAVPAVATYVWAPREEVHAAA